MTPSHAKIWGRAGLGQGEAIAEFLQWEPGGEGREMCPVPFTGNRAERIQGTVALEEWER